MTQGLTRPHLAHVRWPAHYHMLQSIASPRTRIASRSRQRRRTSTLEPKLSPVVAISYLTLLLCASIGAAENDSPLSPTAFITSHCGEAAQNSAGADGIISFTCIWSGSITLVAGPEATLPARPSLTLGPASTAADTPTSLHLSSLTRALAVPATSRLELRGLLVTGAALPTAPYPLPPASFLALSAIRLLPATASSGNASSSGNVTSPSPSGSRLSLRDVVITTPSCVALSLHQDFACRASPSPNFTVTANSLLVHRFTTPTADLTNVSLRCSGPAMPFPCLAVSVSSGAQLLGAISELQDAIQSGLQQTFTPVPAFIHVATSFSLVPPAEGPGSSNGSSSPRVPQPVEVVIPRLVIGGSSINSSSNSTGNSSSSLPAAVLQPPDALPELDLAGSVGLLVLRAGAGVVLQDLVLRRPPLGPDDVLPRSLLRLPLWTFDFNRNMLGWSKGTLLQLARGVVVKDVPRSELAMYLLDDAVTDGSDLDAVNAALPPALRPWRLAVNNGVFFNKQINPLPGTPGDVWVEWFSSKSSITTLSRVLLQPETWLCPGGSSSSDDGGNGSSSNATATTADAWAAALPDKDCLGLEPLWAVVPAGLSVGTDTATAHTAVNSSSGTRARPLVSLSSVSRELSDTIGVLPHDLDAAGAWRTPACTAFLIRSPVSPLRVWPLPVRISEESDYPGYEVIRSRAVLAGALNAVRVLDLQQLISALRLPAAAALESQVAAALAADGGPEVAVAAVASVSLTLRSLVLANLPSSSGCRAGQQAGCEVQLAWLAAGAAAANASSEDLGDRHRHRRQALASADAGADGATQGMPPALANFTSCLWSVEFDRLTAWQQLTAGGSSSSSSSSAAGSLRPAGLPYVFLESVVLLLPAAELQLLAALWSSPGRAAVSAATAAVGGGFAEHLAAALAASSAPLPQLPGAPPSLAFERFVWCGLEGRNVTLTSAVDPAWGIKRGSLALLSLEAQLPQRLLALLPGGAGGSGSGVVSAGVPPPPPSATPPIGMPTSPAADVSGCGTAGTANASYCVGGAGDSDRGGSTQTGSSSKSGSSGEVNVTVPAAAAAAALAALVGAVVVLLLWRRRSHLRNAPPPAAAEDACLKPPKAQKSCSSSQDALSEESSQRGSHASGDSNWRCGGRPPAQGGEHAGFPITSITGRPSPPLSSADTGSSRGTAAVYCQLAAGGAIVVTVAAASGEISRGPVTAAAAAGSGSGRQPVKGGAAGDAAWAQPPNLGGCDPTPAAGSSDSSADFDAVLLAAGTASVDTQANMTTPVPAAAIGVRLPLGTGAGVVEHGAGGGGSRGIASSSAHGVHRSATAVSRHGQHVQLLAHVPAVPQAQAPAAAQRASSVALTVAAARQCVTQVLVAADAPGTAGESECIYSGGMGSGGNGSSRAETPRQPASAAGLIRLAALRLRAALWGAGQDTTGEAPSRPMPTPLALSGTTTTSAAHAAGDSGRQDAAADLHAMPQAVSGGVQIPMSPVGPHLGRASSGAAAAFRAAGGVALMVAMRLRGGGAAGARGQGAGGSAITATHAGEGGASGVGPGSGVQRRSLQVQAGAGAAAAAAGVAGAGPASAAAAGTGRTPFTTKAAVSSASAASVSAAAQRQDRGVLARALAGIHRDMQAMQAAVEVAVNEAGGGCDVDAGPITSGELRGRSHLASSSDGGPMPPTSFTAASGPLPPAAEDSAAAPATAPAPFLTSPGGGDSAAGGSVCKGGSGGVCGPLTGVSITRELGRGAQGVVYAGTWRGLNVAVKSSLLHRSCHAGATATAGSGATAGAAPTAGLHPGIAQAVQEAAISAAVSHPNVVATYTYSLQQLGAGMGVGTQGASLLPSQDTSQLSIDSEAARGEAEAWKLTLVQELCDANSLRHCLATGRLVRARAVRVQQTQPPSGTRVAGSGTGVAAALEWAPLLIPINRASSTSQQPNPKLSTGSGAVSLLRCASALSPLHPFVVGSCGEGSANTSMTVIHSRHDGGSSSGAKPEGTGTRAERATAMADGGQSSSADSQQLQAPAPLSVEVMLSVALQVARGLAHLHERSIVHADVSSANVLLQTASSCASRGCMGQGASAVGGARAGTYLAAPGMLAGPGDVRALPHHAGAHSSLGGSALSETGPSDPYTYGYVAKVCDFGLSGRLDADAGATHISGLARRSSAYSAPELVRCGRAGPASDVYALAVVLWELAWGAPLPALLVRPEGAGVREWLSRQDLVDPAAAEALPASLLPWPAHAPSGYVSLAGECLAAAPAGRPLMHAVCVRLQEMLMMMAQ